MKILELMIGLLTTPYTKNDEYNIKVKRELETNIGKLFAAFGWGLTLVYENAETVRLWANIDNAKGATLDRYGANFGVARGGTKDAFYRLMIKIKMLAQLSGGDIETIIGAVAGLYETDPATLELDELFPAKIRVVILEEDLPEGYWDLRLLVWAMTKRLLAAGVGFIMGFKVVDETGGELFLGGRPITEYSRIRLADYYREIPALKGQLHVGGRPVTEYTRTRLPGQAI